MVGRVVGREPMILLLMSGGAGWDDEVKKKPDHALGGNTLELLGSPSRSYFPSIPSSLTCLRSASAGAPTSPQCRQIPSATTPDPLHTTTTPPLRTMPCSSHTD